MRVIVIGDAHVDDQQSLERFKWASRYINDERPDYVISIGDFLSLNCLSAWDRNKRASMEGKRYAKEIKAGNQALDNLMGDVEHPNHIQWVYLEGNHEYRLPCYLKEDPTFDGAVSVFDDLHLDERGFSWVPYKDHFNILGVNFTHIPISGNGKPISNPTVAQKALRLYNGSVVFGHTHTLDIACEHRHGAAHLAQAMSVGCFFEHVDDYAKGAKTDYWRGLVTLDIYSKERFDITTKSLGQLRREYR